MEKEEQAAFKGWDFSYLENRWDEQELPWNYEDILKKYLNPDYKLLDMGTGGENFYYHLIILIIIQLLQKCGYLMLNYANKN